LRTRLIDSKGVPAAFDIQLDALPHDGPLTGTWVHVAINVHSGARARTGRQDGWAEARQRMMNAADGQDNGGVQVFVDGHELPAEAFGFPIARTPGAQPQVSPGRVCHQVIIFN
jgi:hypothetical protein